MNRHSVPLSETLAEQYQALLEVSESIATSRDLSSLFRDLAQCLPAVAAFDFIGLILHDPARNMMKVHVLETVAAHRLAIRLDGLELPIEESSSGWVWAHQQPLIIPSLAEETRFTMGMAALRDIGVQSACLFLLVDLTGVTFIDPERQGALSSDVATRCEVSCSRMPQHLYRGGDHQERKE